LEVLVVHLAENEMMFVNGELVSARDLAAARQQLAHESAYLPPWSVLTAQEQATAILAAAGDLQALARIAPANPGIWQANTLPTVEEIRARAYAEIGDVLDTLRSDWLSGHGPDDAQSGALADVRDLLTQAKYALGRAAR
jgi:hypothetical protein